MVKVRAHGSSRSRVATCTITLWGRGLEVDPFRPPYSLTLDGGAMVDTPKNYHSCLKTEESVDASVKCHCREDTKADLGMRDAH